MTGKLVICPTPLGNLGDLSLRATEAFKDADVIYAEDTRVTGKLLSALDVSGVSLERLDENLMETKAASVISRVLAGDVVVYCSDAGMPGVSDPGLRLVRAAQESGAPYEVLPGPTAVSTAYVASGTTATNFYFGGFFPRKDSSRKKVLDELAPLPAALIFYESPKRLVSALKSIADNLPHRCGAVCRELTKMHEEITRGSFAQLYEVYASRENVKGEIVIVIDESTNDEAALRKEANDETTARDMLQRAQELTALGEHPKTITKVLVEEFGAARNKAYEIALQAKCDGC